MRFRIGAYCFDEIDWAGSSDELRVALAGVRAVIGDDVETTPEGHRLAFVDGELVGVTLMNPKGIAEQLGCVVVTIEGVEHTVDARDLGMAAFGQRMTGD